MDDTKQFVDNFLAHYSSKYYDPVKAREYYLRTRELKGRRSTKGMTERQKSAWSYTKNELKEAKKKDLKNASTWHQEMKSQARESARKRREALTEKLRGILGMHGLAGEKKQATEEIRARRKASIARLNKRAKAEREKISEEAARKTAKAREKAAQISEEASRKIDALPPIPKGVSKERRAKLAAERSEEIAKIRGDAKSAKTAVGKEIVSIRTDASKKREALSKQVSKERTSISEEASAKQEKLNKDVSETRDAEKEANAKKKEEVRTELKGGVEKARTIYEGIKKDLKAKYEQQSQQEYEAIKRNV